MSAELSGVNWRATEEASASFSSSLLTITGTSSDFHTVTFGSPNVTGEGIYLLGPLNPNGGSANVIQGQRIWTSTLTGGGGYMTITALTDAHVAGTFSFRAVPGTLGTPGVMSVKSGVFDIRF